MAVKKPQLPKGLLEHSEEEIIKKLIEWTQLDAKGMQAFVHDLLQTVNIPVVTDAPVEVVEHPPLLKLMDDGAGTRRLYAYYEDGWSYVNLAGGGGPASEDAFGLIAVAGQTSIEADLTHDTLTIIEGRDITITTDHVLDELTIGISDGNMSHDHDNVYYTTGEVDAIIVGLGGTYYTEAEIDALIALYYTQTQVDTLFTNHGAAANPHTVYILHTLAAAVNDFLVASGANTFVKKTLAETGAILEGDINHDNLVGYDANDHIDHTGVSVIAGAGMTGGGTIAASRTLNVIAGTGITVAADSVSTNDSEIVHDNLSGFVANEHLPAIDEDNMVSNSAVHVPTQQSVKAYVDTEIGALTTDHGELLGLADNDHTQYILHSLADAASDFLVASGDNAFAKKTLAETGALLETDIQHNNLQGIVANQHIDWTLDDAAVIHSANIQDGADGSALHDDVAGEINAIAIKGAPAGADYILLEDSAAAWAKKKALVSSIGGGAASSVSFDDTTLDKFFDGLDDTTDFIQDVLEMIDEQAVEVVESAAAPGTTYPGLLWIDTDAENTAAEPLVVIAIAAASTLVNSSTDKMLWTEQVDTHAVFATSTFTAPSDGLYRVNASCLIGPTDQFTNGDLFDLIVFVNSVQVKYNRVVPNNATSHYVMNSIETVLNLSSGDTVEIYGNQNSGADQPVYVPNGYFGNLSIEFIRSI